MKVGVVCGFQDEVRCFHSAVALSGLDPTLFEIKPSGSSAKRAQEYAQSLVSGGCDRLLSFGVAAGLDPKVGVGDVVFSNHVVTTLDETYGKRKSTKTQAIRLGGGVSVSASTVCGVDEILFTPKDKQALFSQTKAGIADMESHGVARVANHVGIPFFVVRVVSDSAKDRLPSYVADAVDPSGVPQVKPVLVGLMKNPFTLFQLLRLKKNTDKAMASLEQTAARVLPQLIR